MMEYVLNFQFNSLLAVYLYWLPLALCVVGFTAKTWLDYREELLRREECIKTKYTYFPNLTLGVVLGRVFSAVVPGFNILALVFNVGGPMIRSVFEFFGSVFRIPLVRPYQK